MCLEFCVVYSMNESFVYMSEATWSCMQAACVSEQVRNGCTDTIAYLSLKGVQGQVLNATPHHATNSCTSFWQAQQNYKDSVTPLLNSKEYVVRLYHLWAPRHQDKQNSSFVFTWQVNAIHMWLVTDSLFFRGKRAVGFYLNRDFSIA